MSDPCSCFTTPYQFLNHVQELGMDQFFATVTILVCKVCGQKWLQYYYEVEAFTASGRWYLGAISEDQASALTVKNAKDAFENLDWYFCGGSYFEGRTGKASGKILLNPTN